MTRPLLLCTLLAALLAAPLSAREFSVRGNEWDSISQVLNIGTYLFTLRDEAKSRTLELEIEVYEDGKLTKTLSSGPVANQKANSVDLNSGIFFLPAEGGTVRGVITFEAKGGSSKSSFTFPARLIPVGGMTCSSALLHPEDAISVPGKTPLYAIVHTPPKQSSCSVGNTWQEALKANPGATVLVFFLKAE